MELIKKMGTTKLRNILVMDLNLKEAISYGADFGLKSSCLFSILYTVVGTTAWFIITDLLAGFVNGFYIISLTLALVFLMVLAVPLLVLGAITGSTLSVIMLKINRQLSIKKSFFLGVGVGIVILLLTAIVVTPIMQLPSMSEQDRAIYQENGTSDYFNGDPLMTTSLQDIFLFLVLPVSIYLLASGWASQRLYKKYRKPPNPNCTRPGCRRWVRGAKNQDWL